MTTPTLSDLVNDPFLQTLAGRDDSTPLTLNQVAGLLQIAPETLRKRQRLNQEPPVWEDLRNVFPGMASGPVWRVRLGTMRALLNGIYSSAPGRSNAPASPARPLPDHQLLDAASASADGGWMDPPMRGRKRPRHATFADFLTDSTIPTADVHGEPDVWLFMLTGPHKRPVDFFRSLDIKVTDTDACVWLTLDDYLTDLSIAAKSGPDAAFKESRADHLAQRPPARTESTRKRP